MKKTPKILHYRQNKAPKSITKSQCCLKPPATGVCKLTLGWFLEEENKTLMHLLTFVSRFLECLALDL